MLAVLYAANPADWVITQDVGPAGLSNGDTVRFHDRGAHYTFGTTAFGSIQDAVDAAVNGDKVYVEPGIHVEQVVIDGKAITLTGAGNSSIIRSPSTPLTTTFTYAVSGVSYAPIVTVSNTTAQVTNLEIDGNAQGSGNDHFTGLAFYNAGGMAKGLTVVNVHENPLNGVQSGYGIIARADDSVSRSLEVSNDLVAEYQKNGIDVRGTGLSVKISNNTATGVGDTPLIAQNGIVVLDNAVANITSNTVSGNEYSGPGSGADPTADTQSIGILILGAGSGTVVTKNNVDRNDIGIYASGPGTTVSGNTLGNKTANRYEGILVDQGSTTVVKNSVSGGNLGIGVFSFAGNTDNTQATLTSNTVKNAATGVEVFDSDGPGAGVDARASLLGNTITQNGTGVDVDGGTALLQQNDLRKNNIGLLAQDNALIDAGQSSPGSNVTGLGISTGKNDFSTYSTPTTSPDRGAIVDLILAGGPDVLASNNYWNGNLKTTAAVEAVVWDSNDDPSLTTVQLGVIKHK